MKHVLSILTLALITPLYSDACSPRRSSAQPRYQSNAQPIVTAAKPMTAQPAEASGEITITFWAKESKHGQGVGIDLPANKKIRDLKNRIAEVLNIDVTISKEDDPTPLDLHKSIASLGSNPRLIIRGNGDFTAEQAVTALFDLKK
jgi:hypothetical protein